MKNECEKLACQKISTIKYDNYFRRAKSSVRVIYPTTMTTFAKFCAVVAALNGVILLGSVSSASAQRNLSFEVERDGTSYMAYAERSFENTSFVYYSSCKYPGEPKKCLVHRVQNSFSEGGPIKDDKCIVELHPESGSQFWDIERAIAPMGMDRAILCWMEQTEKHGSRRTYRLRFSIVNFSDCKVKTTTLPEDIDIEKIMPYYDYSSFHRRVISSISFKEEDDFDVILFDSVSIHKYSINAEGDVSEVDNSRLADPITIWDKGSRIMLPLSEDKGYLLMESFDAPGRSATWRMGMSLIQPNGRRRNLIHFLMRRFTRLSLDNGLIGFCDAENETLKCTQFKPDEEEINWFSVSLIVDPWATESVYNLPKGEGFLIFTVSDIGDRNYTSNDKQLVKIGLDGKPKQFVNTDMRCREHSEYEKIFRDRWGNYCVSIECRIRDHGEKLKFRSKCFEPKDFKDI
uniref:Uncharacterized protein n=1 Tax=Trichogramma kaykai TaxID=54128 RepID=A0ABD2WHH1_9HYME